MRTHSHWPGFVAPIFVLLVAIVLFVLPAYLSVANIAWLCAFGVGCGGALALLHRSGRPVRTMAQILYDTENPGRSGRSR